MSTTIIVEIEYAPTAKDAPTPEEMLDLIEGFLPSESAFGDDEWFTGITVKQITIKEETA